MRAKSMNLIEFESGYFLIMLVVLLRIMDMVYLAKDNNRQTLN